MSYGDLPKSANDYSPGNLMMPRGAIIDGNLNEIQDIDLDALDEVQEYVNHSWYKYGDEQKGLHPYEGETVPNFDIGGAKGTKTRIEAVDESSKYSWVKSPRWKGHAMEVGPLARYVIGYVKGIPEFKEPTDMVLQKLGGVPVTALFSTLGRTAARGLECSWAAHKLKDEFNKLIANIKAGDTATGSTSKTRRSRTTSASCRPPGTRARVTRPARSARTRLRCSTPRCTIPSSRSRSCAPSIASIHAWRALRTCSTWRATRSRASRSGKE
jgi:hydrogenase large subunit